MAYQLQVLMLTIVAPMVGSEKHQISTILVDALKVHIDFFLTTYFSSKDRVGHEHEGIFVLKGLFYVFDRVAFGEWHLEMNACGTGHMQ